MPGKRPSVLATAEPTLEFASAPDWFEWLKAHHGKSKGVWLRLGKGAKKSLTYSDALDAALAWGWIDSQKRAIDADAWLQRFSPRTATSPWSKINRAKAEAQIAAGTMQAPGLAEVERAKKDCRGKCDDDGARTSTLPA